MASADAALPTASSADAHAAALASLDALVIGESRAVTYRTLSAATALPTRAAQAALVAYAGDPGRAKGLVVMWAVVVEGEGGCAREVVLVQGGGQAGYVGGKRVLSRSVWGVAKRGVTEGEGAVWVAEDLGREVKMVGEGKEVENDLRVERFAVVSSRSAAWNRSGAGKAGECVRNGIGGPLGGRRVDLVGKGKAAHEGKDEVGRAKDELGSQKQEVGGRRKGRVQGSSRLNALVEKIKREEVEREKSRAAAKKRRGDVDQFTVPRGAAKKGVGKAGPKPPPARPGGKPAVPRRTRKIGDSDDDEDDADRGGDGEEDDMGEEEEEAEEVRVLEREAEEAEEAARAREQTGRGAEPKGEDGEAGAGEVDSDMVIEASNEVGAEAMAAAESPSKGRKSGPGCAGEAGPAVKRIKRMVDESFTDEKGYIVSRQVAKWFDGDGVEVPDAATEGAAREEAREQRARAASPTVRLPGVQKADSRAVPQAQAAPKAQGAAVAAAKPKPNARDGAAGGGGGGARKKKAKGNIASFFGKM